MKSKGISTLAVLMWVTETEDKFFRLVYPAYISRLAANRMYRSFYIYSIHLLVVFFSFRNKKTERYPGHSLSISRSKVPTSLMVKYELCYMCSTEKTILECLSRDVLLDNMKELMFSFLEVR